MKVDLLSIEEAEAMTNSVVDQILNVDADKITKEFYYWQGIITALTMIISAQKTIEELSKELENQPFSHENEVIDFIYKMKESQGKIIEEANFNYNTYEKLLFELGVKIE